MATNQNPRIPEDRDVHPKIRFQPRSRIPWVLIAIIVAAAILIALIIWLPRTPRQWAPSGAQVPPQPTGSQIQFTNLTLTPAPTGGAMYVEGRLVNTGPTDITGVTVDATFKGINGANLETIRKPVEGFVGGSATAVQPLAQAPIKPGEARPVRIAFDHLPAPWNHKLPALTIVQVTAAGQPNPNKLGTPAVKQEGGTPKPARE